MSVSHTTFIFENYNFRIVIFSLFNAEIVWFDSVKFAIWKKWYSKWGLYGRSIRHIYVMLATKELRISCVIQFTAAALYHSKLLLEFTRKLFILNNFFYEPLLVKKKTWFYWTGNCNTDLAEFVLMYITQDLRPLYRSVWHFTTPFFKWYVDHSHTIRVYRSASVCI